MHGAHVPREPSAKDVAELSRESIAMDNAEVHRTRAAMDAVYVSGPIEAASETVVAMDDSLVCVYERLRRTPSKF